MIRVRDAFKFGWPPNFILTGNLVKETNMPKTKKSTKRINVRYEKTYAISLPMEDIYSFLYIIIFVIDIICIAS
jgi:hypothetical protein